jgi:ABC-2 type transport system ATP-binding protein
LWPSLSGGEIIDLLGRLHGGIDARRKADLLERFDLDPAKKARAYSKGNRQKVALIAALACDVELLILDEPTSGLDPLMEAQFRSCIEEDRQAGRTVLLSSHILAEAEALCDRVTIISGGRAVESGTLTELRHLTRTSISAELARPVVAGDAPPGVHDLDVAGNRLHGQVDAGAMEAFMRWLAGYGIRSLTSQPPTLEELFLSHYQQPSAGSKSAGVAP